MDKTCLVTRIMDANWLAVEVLNVCDLDPVVLHWNEMDREAKALSMAGKSPVCDRELSGCDLRFKDILKLYIR